jgi:hypothetical protein
MRHVANSIGLKSIRRELSAYGVCNNACSYAELVCHAGLDPASLQRDCGSEAAMTVPDRSPG